MKQITGKQLKDLIEKAFSVYMVDEALNVTAIFYEDDDDSWILTMDATDIDGQYYEFGWNVASNDLFDIDEQYIYLPDEENVNEPHKIQLLMPVNPITLI